MKNNTCECLIHEIDAIKVNEGLCPEYTPELHGAIVELMECKLGFMVPREIIDVDQVKLNLPNIYRWNKKYFRITIESNWEHDTDFINIMRIK